MITNIYKIILLKTIFDFIFFPQKIFFDWPRTYFYLYTKHTSTQFSSKFTGHSLDLLDNVLYYWLLLQHTLSNLYLTWSIN